LDTEGGSTIKVGIITFDSAFAHDMRQALVQHGISVIDNNGASETADLILLDCRASNELPAQYRRLREEHVIIPIVQSGSELAINEFVDVADIIFYPCTTEELIARIRLTASRNQIVYDDDVLDLGGFHINFSNYEVSIDGKPLDLTFKEYELLRHLAMSPGRVFSRSQLLKSIWGYDYIEGARTVDVHIRRLRSKLGSKYAALIETVRHVGYRFKRM
jgi:DNA-binding response OmpR family regulator